VAAVSVASVLARKFGKKAMFIFAIGFGGLVVAGFAAAKPTDIWLIFALQIVSSFVIGFNSPLVFAMFADVADEAAGLCLGDLLDQGGLGGGVVDLRHAADVLRLRGECGADGALD
jgi:MFS family permease